ncbi:hypothetical protein AHAS_Ahas02G0194400 [Arachis hypogaea]
MEIGRQPLSTFEGAGLGGLGTGLSALELGASFWHWICMLQVGHSTWRAGLDWLALELRFMKPGANFSSSPGNALLCFLVCLFFS